VLGRVVDRLWRRWWAGSGPFGRVAGVGQAGQGAARTLRARGTGHNAALRQLANRLVGILHGCLTTGTRFDETKAWTHHRNEDHQAAA